MPYRQDKYVIELMKTGLLFLWNGKIKPNVHNNNYDPFRSLMVYCITQIKPGLWLPLNRDYNILGLIKKEWSDYKSDLYEHMLLKTDEINFDLLWDNDTERKNGESNNFFVFSDGSYPRLYYKKTKESLKLTSRYEDILAHSFFGVETKLKFQDVWGYKNNSMYAQYYRKNINRYIAGEDE
jgi:hypothetical protein